MHRADVLPTPRKLGPPIAVRRGTAGPTRWRRRTTSARRWTRSATTSSPARLPRSALNRLLRRGTDGRNGLDALRRQARERARELRHSGQLDGTLQKVKELLDQAVEAERRELFPDPADSARMAEAELDTLPDDTARAVRQLSRLPVALGRGPAGVPADPGHAARRGARRAVRRDARRDAERDAGGHGAHPRDDERAQRHARRRRARRAHAGAVRRVHAATTATSSRSRRRISTS